MCRITMRCELVDLLFSKMLYFYFWYFKYILIPILLYFYSSIFWIWGLYLQRKYFYIAVGYWYFYLSKTFEYFFHHWPCARTHTRTQTPPSRSRSDPFLNNNVLSDSSASWGKNSFWFPCATFWLLSWAQQSSVWRHSFAHSDLFNRLR